MLLRFDFLQKVIDLGSHHWLSLLSTFGQAELFLLPLALSLFYFLSPFLDSVKLIFSYFLFSLLGETCSFSEVQGFPHWGSLWGSPWGSLLLG